MDDDFEWSHHTLDAAYLCDSKLGRDFVKVQVSDLNIHIQWMKGENSISNSKTLDRKHIIRLVDISHFKTEAVVNEEECIPLRAEISVLLRINIKPTKTKAGKIMHYYYI